jgi:hypothetical protein
VSNFVEVDSIFGPVRTDLGVNLMQKGRGMQMLAMEKRKGFNYYAN